jgi:hypothetical protein
MDTTFLQQLNIMDYSLLLIIAKNDRQVGKIISEKGDNPSYFYSKNKNYVLAVGLIDYLQIFNFQKNV